jgi:hypothetical protein
MINISQQYTLRRPIQAYRVGDDIFLMDCMPHHQHVSARQTPRGLVDLSVYPDGSHVMAVFDGVFYGADYAESPRTIDERWAMTEQFLQDITTVVPE